MTSAEAHPAQAAQWAGPGPAPGFCRSRACHALRRRRERGRRGLVRLAECLPLPGPFALPLAFSFGPFAFASSAVAGPGPDRGPVGQTRADPRRPGAAPSRSRQRSRPQRTTRLRRGWPGSPRPARPRAPARDPGSRGIGPHHRDGGEGGDSDGRGRLRARARGEEALERRQKRAKVEDVQRLEPAPLARVLERLGERAPGAEDQCLRSECVIPSRSAISPCDIPCHSRSRIASRCRSGSVRSASVRPRSESYE